MVLTLDRFISQIDDGLRAVSAASVPARPLPASTGPTEMSAADRRLSGSLMRVNHVGEICAQALYQAQALVAGDERQRAWMQQAAQDETDHMAWTAQRLRDLGDRPSLLNPLWFAGAFAVGLLAGKAGDAWSLGFVVETERQVEQHLAGHLQRLPSSDTASRAIVEQMQRDEARHADAAVAAGARPLPAPLAALMRGAARVMTTTAHWI